MINWRKIKKKITGPFRARRAVWTLVDLASEVDIIVFRRTLAIENAVKHKDTWPEKSAESIFEVELLNKMMSRKCHQAHRLYCVLNKRNT